MVTPLRIITKIVFKCRFLLTTIEIGDQGVFSYISNRFLQEVEPTGTTDEPTTPADEGTTTDPHNGTGKKKQTWSTYSDLTLLVHHTIEGLGYSFFFIFLSELGDKVLVSF